MRIYMLSLKLQANPEEALAEYLPAIAPENRLIAAIMTISRPIFKIADRSAFCIPSSMIIAVTKGRRTSIITSSVVNPIVR